MSMLTGFPMVDQKTPITSDGRPSENAQQDCVAASLCAMCMYLNGIKQMDHDKYNVDKFKDMAYGEALRNSGTAAVKYVDYCKSLGVKLYPVDGGYPSLIAQAHTFLADGKPVMFTQDDWIVDTSLPEYQGWTHVAAWYADGPGTLTSMDPWGGFPRMKSDAGWKAVMRFNEIWIAERLEETVRIDITTPGVSYFFEETDAHHWRCKQTGHLLGYGMLDFYKGFGNAALCGLTYLGLNKTDEVPIEKLSPAYVHLAGKGITVQFFERGATIYDPGHLVDNPPGAGSVYLLQLYNNGPGQDPGIAKLQAAVADLTAANNMQAQKITDLQHGQTLNPQLLPDMQQIKSISGKY